MTHKEQVEVLIKGLIADGIWKNMNWQLFCAEDIYVKRVGKEGYEIIENYSKTLRKLEGMS